MVSQTLTSTYKSGSIKHKTFLTLTPGRLILWTVVLLFDDNFWLIMRHTGLLEFALLLADHRKCSFHLDLSHKINTK